MSVNINEFKLFTEYVSNKSQQGNSMTIPQFNENCYRALMQKFESDRQVFVQTGVASDFFQSFLSLYTAQPNPVSGYLAYPSDWQHTSAARSYYNGNEYPVIQIESVKWGDILISQLDKPSRRFPKYAEFGNEYRFVPKDIGTVFIDYFRLPVAPVWGYTVVNNRPVYDPVTSVDLDCEQFSVNEIAGMFLALNGVNLKDQDLSMFAAAYKQETKSVI